METQIFDLSKPLALRYDKVAYLVDEKNVELYRQYIEKLGSHALPHPRTGARIEMRKLDRIRKRPYRDPMEPSGSFFLPVFFDIRFQSGA